MASGLLGLPVAGSAGFFGFNPPSVEAAGTDQPAKSSDDLEHLSLEELVNMQVTSVSKKETDLFTSPAAIYVITQEDIRRSGMTSIPELLWMVPDLEVARIDANHWTITVRGFSGQDANKLLVLMDGRSVYTPVSAGVDWNVQDMPLGDFERIAVIRGPGAALTLELPCEQNVGAAGRP